LNFRRILTDIDVESLLTQILANEDLWQRNTEWTATAKQTVLYAHENIVLRYDRIDPFIPTLNKPPFTVLKAAWPLIQRLAHAVDHDIIGNVMISRMAPGDAIEPHRDTAMAGTRMPDGSIARIPVPSRYQRYQIPLFTAPGVDFICNGERQEMQVGEAWWFDNQQLHSVVNNSSDIRISMIADISSFAFL